MATTSELASAWVRRREFGNARIFSVSGQRAFYKALLVCCKGDQIISPAEREWVIGSAAALGAPEDLIDELLFFDGWGTVSDVLSEDAYESKHGRRALVYEAIRACISDSEYSEGEKALVRRMAQQLGLTAEIVVELETLVFEAEMLRRRTIQALFKDGSSY